MKVEILTHTLSLTLTLYHTHYTHVILTLCYQSLLQECHQPGVKI